MKSGFLDYICCELECKILRSDVFITDNEDPQLVSIPLNIKSISGE